MTDLKPVSSSNIHAVGYDPAKSELHVRFRDGGSVYVYSGVPAETHAALMNAESVGSHFHQHIKGKFVHRKE